MRLGNAKVPAGDYQFSFDPSGISSVLALSKISGAPAWIHDAGSGDGRDDRRRAMSRLVLETTSDGSYVSAMQLPEFGMTLHFNVPAHATEKQIAKAATTASASGQ